MATKTDALVAQLNRDKKRSRQIQNQVDFAKAVSTEAAIKRRGRNA